MNQSSSKEDDFSLHPQTWVLGGKAAAWQLECAKRKLHQSPALAVARHRFSMGAQHGVLGPMQPKCYGLIVGESFVGE